MKKVVLTALLAVFALLAGAQDSQTAFNFLRLPVSAHATALGGENITIDDEGIIRFISNDQETDQTDINGPKADLLAFFQRTFDSIAAELTPALWTYFVAHVTRLDFHFSFTMVEKHLYVIDKNKRTYDAGVLTPVSANKL